MKSTIAGFMSGTAVSALAIASVSVLATLSEDRPASIGLISDTAQTNTLTDDVTDGPEREPEALSQSPEVVLSDEPSGEKSLVETGAHPAASSLAMSALASAGLQTPVPDVFYDNAPEISAGLQPDVAVSKAVLPAPEPVQNELDATPWPKADPSSSPTTDLFDKTPPDQGALGQDGTPHVAPAPVAIEPEKNSVSTLTASERQSEAVAQAEQVETDPEQDLLQSLSEDEPVLYAPASEPVEASAGTIGDLAKDVTTNRLPVVGQEDTLDVPGSTSQSIANAENLPPLERHAVPFDAPSEQPLLSIILIDDGTLSVGPDALADFPHPVSVAIDVTRSDGADIAQRYRAAGHEVLAMTNLPEAATAQDAEVAMATYLDAIPQAVAIFEGSDGGLQSSREVSKQMGDILRDTGHGIILRPNGLNSAQKLIAQKGVPSATFFRDLDGAGEDTRMIRRSLDQAVFRAGQSGDNLVIVGRLKADTISALVLWSLQDRASAISLAPVSAVLRGAQS